MDRYAILAAGVVTNFAEASPDYAAEQGWIAAGPQVALGDLYDLAAGFSTPSQPLTELQATLAAAATARRWEVETGGIVLPNGVHLNTGRGDQDAITRVIVNAGAAGLSEIPFKAASGWISISIDELRGMASVIARHVQACYGREREHHEAIATLQTVEAAEAYDIGTGWPSNTEATT